MRAGWKQADLDRIADMVGDGQTDYVISKAFGCTADRIAYARRCILRIGKTANPMRALPSDFAEMAPTLLRIEAGEHWGASDQVLSRWIKEADVSFKPRFAPKVKPVARAAVRQIVVPAVPPIPSGMADRAAHHLRSRYRPVCRARTICATEPDGIWLCGSLRLNEDRLIKLAEKHGFSPMGWAA